MSSGTLVLLMLVGVFVAIFSGYPIIIGLAGVAAIVGIGTLGVGPAVGIFYSRFIHILTSFNWLAVVLFVYMGLFIEQSGAAERLYAGIEVVFRRVRGSLAVVTIVIGAMLATCLGTVSASVATVGLISAPSMVKRGYSRPLLSGSVCAAGSLGILIPPSVMLVIYGPMADLSVGKLFMAAFIPGFLLAILYIAYVVVICTLKPSLAPRLTEEVRVPQREQARRFVTGVTPTLGIMLVVLGSIFFGVATPSEAAAMGAVAATLLAIGYRTFNLQMLKTNLYQTVRVGCMIVGVALSATMFTGIFFRIGGDRVVTALLASLPLGKWGIFLIIMIGVLILGMLVDWIAIAMIFVPIITPLAPTLGFDPLWFSMMIIVNFQASFLTPPIAHAIWYFKGITQPEWGITDIHIMKGVVPFVCLVIVDLVLCAVFPQIILWLPNIAIK